MNYNFFFPRLLVDSLLLVCFASFAFGATRLSPDEVQALKDIGKTLGIGKTWNFSVDPCSEQLGWDIPPPTDPLAPNNVSVKCGNCSILLAADQICHVTNILLNGEDFGKDLQGQLPRALDLSKLPYLQEIDLSDNNLSGTIPPEWGSLPLVTIDLSYNYLNGTIPPEWGSLPLVTIDLSGNYLNGTIPPEWGSLPLVTIDLSDNYLNGTIPPEWGSLPLVTINLSRNYLSGTIPPEWGSLPLVTINLSDNYLSGTIPPEWGSLPLVTIDLSRNYLSGTIPPEWGSLRLVTISLDNNRLTGSIPPELGNIATLKTLTLDSNSFTGVLPRELGDLSSIEIMHLTSNNFTGELPKSFAGLTTLKDFQISDSSFFGKIPNFIQNWTNLETLVIQASGFTGPIPSGISLLTNLTTLIITDLNESESPFPLLDNMEGLLTLILRNCNISGHIPENLGNMTWTTLDLSFNKLTGEIPKSWFTIPERIYYLFLTGNMLTGSVPTDWIQAPSFPGAPSIDVSYNNFTLKSKDEACKRRDDGWNLFASSSGGNTSSVSCLPITKCPKIYYDLHINCGGKGVDLHENFTRPIDATYEEDTDKAGPSSVYRSTTNWASSTTGYFVVRPNNFDSRPDNDNAYIGTNSSGLSMTNPELYMNARLSPISLTYYGFCLANGSYTVNLHFAEIVFTNGKTYRSLGRRVFDIYIQGTLVLKDFNIADEAAQFGDAVIKNFTANVTSNTLEIRLFWAGKGTTGVPYEGHYGPLISAISIVSDFDPPQGTSPGTSPGGGNGISAGEVVGIVAGGVFIILLILGILRWKRFKGTANTLEQDLKGVDLQTGKFTLRQIKTATNNFDILNKIGEGGFGPVYKGLLSDNTTIAVKKLSAKSKQGNREFVNEIGMISALQHPNLVKLYGCCIEGNNLLLIYEYMENNSVARALFGPKATQVKLDWPTRHRICVGMAKGLAYLHEESRLKIVHRDIKASNVLLDKNLFPKISDFGMAKLDEEDNTHISTRIAGTFGYMAPEYAMRGYLTDKADVYSFGIVVLEIVSGRPNTTYHSKEECFYLLDWAFLLKESGSLLDLVDPRLGSEFNKEEMITTINVALLCSHVSLAVRPAMSSVVRMLEGRVSVHEVVSDPNASSNESDAMRKHFQSNFEETNGDRESQRQTMSIEWTASSTSAHDLYSIHPDSSNESDAMKKHFQSNFEETNGDSESQRQTMSIEWTASSTSAHDLYSVHPDSSTSTDLYSVHPDSNYWENRN